MFDKTILELKERIENADSIKSEERSALLKLIGELKVEITALSNNFTNQDAKSIAGFTQIAAHLSLENEEGTPDYFEYCKGRFGKIRGRVRADLSHFGQYDPRNKRRLIEFGNIKIPKKIKAAHTECAAF